jgi:hypothetical protein
MIFFFNYRIKLLKLRDCLSEDLFRNIFAQISPFSSEITFLASFICRMNVEQQENTPILPDAVLAFRFSCIDYDIGELILDEISISDAMLETLASGRAAKSLRKLSVRVFDRVGRITDRSSHLWTKFTRLETLYATGNAWMGLETLRQIASCRDLISLKVSKPLDEPKKSCDDCISILLGESSLPNLRRLSIDLSEVESLATLETLHRVLKTRRAPLGRLNKLSFALEPDDNIADLALTIHDQCQGLQVPILRYQPYVFEKALFRGPFRSLTSIMSLSITAEDLSLLADLCRGVQKLRFQNVSGVLDLAVFERFPELILLHSGNIHCLTVPKLVALPYTLTELEIECQESLSDSEMDNLVDSICTHNTNLRFLLLNQCQKFYTAGHFRKLFQSLLKLERLTIDSNLPYNRNIQVIHELSHPTMKLNPTVKLTEYLKLEPKFLPSYRCIRHGYLRTQDLETCGLDAYPAATEVQYTLDPDDVPKMFELLSRPTAWHITGFGSSLIFSDPRQLELLPTLRHLESVVFPFNTFDQSLVKSLFDNLPLLSTFNACVMVSDYSGNLTSWIKHKRLARLSIGLRGRDESAQHHGMSFDGHNLPSLTFLHVNYDRIVSLASVELRGFDKVQKLALHGRQPKETDSIRLALSDFPSLCSTYLASVSLYSLSISGVPLLYQLEMKDCGAHPEMSFDAFDIPKWATVTGLAAVVDAHEKMSPHPLAPDQRAAE